MNNSDLADEVADFINYVKDHMVEGSRYTHWWAGLVDQLANTTTIYLELKVPPAAIGTLPCSI